MVYDKRMKRVWWGIFICSLLFNFVFLVQNYNRTRVVAVPDGDSIQLSDGRRVRLLGIDARKRGGAWRMKHGKN